MNEEEDSEADLRQVFQLCRPRHSDQKISLETLKSLFRQHTAGSQNDDARSPWEEEEDVEEHHWISFAEFRSALASLADGGGTPTPTGDNNEEPEPEPELELKLGEEHSLQSQTSQDQAPEKTATGSDNWLLDQPLIPEAASASTSLTFPVPGNPDGENPTDFPDGAGFSRQKSVSQDDLLLDEFRPTPKPRSEKSGKSGRNPTARQQQLPVAEANLLDFLDMADSGAMSTFSDPMDPHDPRRQPQDAHLQQLQPLSANTTSSSTSTITGSPIHHGQPASASSPGGKSPGMRRDSRLRDSRRRPGTPGDCVSSPTTSLADSAIGGSASPDADADADLPMKSSQCSSLSDPADREEENFESYGENDDVEYESSELAEFDEIDSSRVVKSSPIQERNFVRRNSWMRTSLRRSPGSSNGNQDQLVPPRRWGSFRHTPKRVGSNALASALYHNGTSSFNSSGRSSNCDDGDMQSDISLEEDVNDLNQKVHMLQQQVGHLAESQASTDDKYSKVKQDNSTLTARIHMLEEHIRELELRSEERLEQEQKRNREIVQRIEREKQLEIENYAFRLQSLEKDHSNLQEEASHLRSSLERLKQEKRSAEDYLIDAQQGLSALKERHLKLEEVLRREQETFQGERSHNEQLVRELNKEVEDLRSQLHLRRASAVQRQTSSDVEVDFLPGEELLLNSSPARLAELQEELQAFRDRQRVLEKENEDLKGQILNRSVEEGKSLLDATGGLGVHGSSNGGSNSLAEEFKQMSENEIRTALKDQQDVNVQLRSYIDGILMNIIEKYPELLEVRK